MTKQNAVGKAHTLGPLLVPKAPKIPQGAFCYCQFISEADFDAVSNKRAIDPPTKDFWTVHLVGTFYTLDEDDNLMLLSFGWAPHSTLANTAFVFMQAMDEYADSEFNFNPKYSGLSDPEKEVIKANFIQRTIAHEIGHLLHVEHPVPPVDGIMRDGNGLKLETRTTPENLQFNLEDLKAFQAITMPR